VSVTSQPGTTRFLIALALRPDPRFQLQAVLAERCARRRLQVVGEVYHLVGERLDLGDRAPGHHHLVAVRLALQRDNLLARADSMGVVQDAAAAPKTVT
jgi:hypothetical protein